MGFRPLVTCQRYLRHCLSVRGALPRRIPPRVRKWRMKNLGDSWPTGGLDQVWSLTQFYSVVFSKSRNDVKKCVFNKRTIKVSCSWRCPGTSASSAAHLIPVSLIPCNSGINAQGKSKVLEGHRVSSKRPSRVWDRDEGVFPEQHFPRGSLKFLISLSPLIFDCPPRPPWCVRNMPAKLSQPIFAFRIEGVGKLHFFSFLGLFTFVLLYFYWFPHFQISTEIN